MSMAFSGDKGDEFEVVHKPKCKPVRCGFDEIATDFYMCSVCEDRYIVNGFKYCPKCGVEIDWKGKVE